MKILLVCTLLVFAAARDQTKPDSSSPTDSSTASTSTDLSSNETLQKSKEKSMGGDETNNKSTRKADEGRTRGPQTDSDEGRTRGPQTDSDEVRRRGPQTDSDEGRTLGPQTDSDEGRTRGHIGTAETQQVAGKPARDKDEAGKSDSAHHRPDSDDSPVTDSSVPEHYARQPVVIFVSGEYASSFLDPNTPEPSTPSTDKGNDKQQSKKKDCEDEQTGEDCEWEVSPM